MPALGSTSTPLPPLGSAALDFVRTRHLAVLSTYGPGGGIHSVPVGFTWDDGLVRIITSSTSQKVANLRRDDRATVCQVDGAQWITVSGTAEVSDDPDVVADAVVRYAERYRQPRPNPLRVAILLRVESMLASSAMRGE